MQRTTEEAGHDCVLKGDHSLNHVWKGPECQAEGLRIYLMVPQKLSTFSFSLFSFFFLFWKKPFLHFQGVEPWLLWLKGHSEIKKEVQPSSL